MVYKDLIKLCSERKEKLTDLLENDSLDLDNDRVNQIKGAIDEVEFFLMTLQHHQEKYIHKNFNKDQGINLPKEKPGIAKRFSKIFKSGKTQSSKEFSLNESYKAYESGQ